MDRGFEWWPLIFRDNFFFSRGKLFWLQVFTRPPAHKMTGVGSAQNQQGQQSLSSPAYQEGQSERKKSREIIHSGHFMVSDFEAEARDDDDEVAIPIPENADDPLTGPASTGDLPSSSPGDLVTVRHKKSDASSPGRCVPPLGNKP